MRSKLIDWVDTTYITERIIGDDGLIKLLPAEAYKDIPQDHLFLWCVQNAIYQLPTLELIEWLKKFEDAIEICAGNVCLGRFLNIRSTDNYCQQIPEVKMYYAAIRQTPTNPPAFVENIEANEAIKKYKPKTVIGSFVTQKYNGVGEGNDYGPMEEEIIKSATYVHIGNEDSHADKRILSKRHKVYRFPWLVTRSIDQKKNIIWVWNKD